MSISVSSECRGAIAANQVKSKQLWIVGKSNACNALFA